MPSLQTIPNFYDDSWSMSGRKRSLSDVTNHLSEPRRETRAKTIGSCELSQSDIHWLAFTFDKNGGKYPQFSLKGQWKKHETLICLHLTEKFAWANLNDICELAQLCGVNRHSHAIHKHIKSTLGCDKWSHRNFEQMRKLCLALIPQYGALTREQTELLDFVVGMKKSCKEFMHEKL